MLRREECRCVSDTRKGWLAFIAEDADDAKEPERATQLPAVC